VVYVIDTITRSA